MTYTRDLKVLALPKNLSGTRALRELHSTTDFMQIKLMLHEIIINGYTSISIKCNDS